MLDEARLQALRARLAELVGRSPTLAAQMGGVDPADLRTPQDFERLPVLRKAQLAAMQAAAPPFGALASSPMGAFTRLFASPEGGYQPESAGRDPWGAARAFVAAGVIPGEIVVNGFSYHLSPAGRIMESGALTLGALVIPAGPDDMARLIAAIVHFRASVFTGPPDLLRRVIGAARASGADVSSLRKALVAGGALSASLRTELESAGVRARQAYASADLGVIAFETDGPDGVLLPGMLVNDDNLVEILVPGTNRPVPEGEVGEVVVTRLRGDYPLLRFATGDLSSWAAHLRLKGLMGRAETRAGV